jgi:hypothetical protein
MHLSNTITHYIFFTIVFFLVKHECFYDFSLIIVKELFENILSIELNFNNEGNWDILQNISRYKKRLMMMNFLI